MSMLWPDITTWPDITVWPGDDTPIVIPDAPTPYDIRLRQYNPDGTRGRILKGATNIVVTLVDSGSSTLKFSLPFGGKTLQAPLVVGIEYCASGGLYEEPRNNLFICDEDDSDSTDVSDTISFTGESYVPWLLGRNLLHWDPDVRNGERHWIQYPHATRGGSATPGFILDGMLDEGQARGWGPMVDWDFTATKDSAGANWSLAGETLWWTPWKLLTPVSSVLAAMSQQGYCEWWTEGTTLRMVRPGTGEDLTAKVALGGMGFTRAPRRASFKDVFTDLTVVPEKSRYWLYLENTGADDRFGALESTLTLSGVEDHTVATEIAQSTLLAGRSLKLELSFQWAVTEGMPRPLLDFNIGDLVRVRENRHTWAEHRVIGLVLTKNETVTVTAVTGDKLLTHAAKIAAKVGSAQVGSAIPGGSGVALPQSTGPASEAPAVPTGLSVASNEGYFADDGSARARVTLEWNPVTETEDGAVCDVDAYEVWHRVGDAAPRSVRVLDVSVLIDSWESGVERLVKVRARSTAGVWGGFSTEIAVTPATPADDLPTPTVPSLSSARGVVTATWDGKLAGPVDPPAGFRAVTAEASLTEHGTYVPVGQSLSKAGYMSIPDYDVGDTVWVRFVAIDRLGRATDPSTAVSITVTGVGGPDIEANAVDANHIAAGAIEAQHLNVGVGDTGPHMELVGTGLTLFDENDAPTVSLTTASDQLISVSKVGPDGDLIPAAAIDSDGGGTFEAVAVTDDVTVGGVAAFGEFAGLTYNGQTIDTPLLERLPRGIVYRAGLGTDSGGALLINPVSTTIQALGSGQASFHPDRLYDVSLDAAFAFQWSGAVSSGGVAMEVWFGDDPQDVGSPNGTLVRWRALESNAPIGVAMVMTFPASVPIELSGDKYVLVRLVKTGTARNYVVSNIDVEPNLIIRDVGPVIDATDGGSIKTRATAGTVAPPVSQPTTKTWEASWSANYSSGGGKITGAGGLYNDYRMVQGGGIGGGSNDRMGLIGFPDLGLSGKTVTGAWVYLKNRHTGLGSGATVKLAASNLTSAPSSAPTPGATRWNSSTKKGEGKWHALPSSLYSAIASGSFRCLQIGGPGVNSTNGSDYCIFDGDYDTNAATSNAVHPVLKVSYK